MSDPLLAGLAEGREDAFAALYDRYGRSLFRVAWTLLRSRADAEDAVQEVFLGLVRARATIARIENLRAYLFAALRHAAARLAARQPPAASAADAAVDVPAPGEPDTELSEPLSRALAALPLPQREVVTLKVDGGLTFAEVATELHAPAAARRPRGRWNILWRVAAAIALILNLGVAVRNGVRFARWAARPDGGLATPWRPPLNSLDVNDPLQRAAAGALEDLRPTPDVGRLGRSIFDYRDEEDHRWATP